MANSEIVVGLDIGTTKICAIVGRRTDYGKIEVLGLGKTESFGVSRGVVSNIEKTVNGIKEAVELASAQSKADIFTVNVGIAGQHIRSQQHRGLRVRNNNMAEISQADIDALIEDMNRLLMPPGEQIIHILPQDYTIDNEAGILDPIGMAGIRMEANFHIITGQVTAISNIQKCVNRAGLETENLVLEPLASSESVLSKEEKDAGVVLVDIGGGTTDVAIFLQDIIRHTAVIPLGGNIVTEDIREGCMVMKNQAELLKIKFGSALADENKDTEIISIPGLRGREAKEISVKNLAYIIQARMEEIIEHVYYEIKNSGLEKKLIAGIVITGGGSQLKHLPQLVEYMTGMDARIGYPTEHIARSNINDIASPMYATAIGLLIDGVNTAERRDKKEETKEVKQKTAFTFFGNLIQKSANLIVDNKGPDDKEYLDK